MSARTVLITGASRGVGARVATLLAAAGADIVINYRERVLLAERVAAAVGGFGRKTLTAQADLTDSAAVRRMFEATAHTFGKVDVLLLNASGGLEQDKATGYAMRLNVEAQSRAVDLALPLMPVGGRIVFVTSHAAHFHGRRPIIPEYEPVAAAKRAGEDALRARIPELTARGIGLVVVSGGLIDRTVTAMLLERALPGLLAEQRASGRLLSVDQFASAVAEAALDPGRATGTTVFVGSAD